MGSTSDLPVMEKAAKLLGDEWEIPFELLRTLCPPLYTGRGGGFFARPAKGLGVEVIIAGAGMAAAFAWRHRCQHHRAGHRIADQEGVLDGMDAMYAILQMPPGIPVATVAIPMEP